MTYARLSGKGKIWKWANSTLARIPKCIVNHPDFPFEKGDIIMVELDPQSKRIIISKKNK